MIEGKLRAVRHLFGNEPKDSEVLHFVHHQLLQSTVTSRTGRS
ncbi:DUF2992 family protein [Bacillus haynesii]|nr:DUF2992 family protein [Bacillus haynesii]MEC1457490.1 DUF2992 family protein [Bacillus haynesii]MEC1575490.1 DUF2992 family protein [Bacillus haynesii]